MQTKRELRNSLGRCNCRVDIAESKIVDGKAALKKLPRRSRGRRDIRYEQRARDVTAD